MSHDSCRAALASDWLVFFSSMARTKITPRKGEKGKPKKVKTRVEVHVQPEEPPVPEVEAPPTPSEMERRRAEAERLEELGRLLESSLTQQLAQMAVEARPSMLGREEPPRRNLQLTMVGKASWMEFLQAGKVKKPQRYWLGMVALHKIHQF